MIKVSVAVFLLALGYLQYTRIFTPEKEVAFHHYEACQKFAVELPILDITRFQNKLLAVGNDINQYFTDFSNASFGKIYYLEEVDSGNLTVKELEIKDFPDGVGFYPFGMYLLKPNLLYVVNNAMTKGGSRLEVFNISSTATWIGHSKFDKVGIFGDLVMENEKEGYFSQYSSVQIPSDRNYSFMDFLLGFAKDFLQIKDSYVYHCKIGETTECTALNETKSNSVTGITKSKFGDYYAAHSSIDENYIAHYRKNSESGTLELKSKLGVRDRCERLEWDEPTQRVYGTATPWYGDLLFFSKLVPSGAVEMRSWEHKPGNVYRRLFMQKDLLRGGSCSARHKNFVALGSYLEKAVLVCPIVGPRT